MHNSVRWLRAGAILASLSLTLFAGCSLTSTQSNTYLQDPLTSNSNNWIVDANCFFSSDGYHIKASVLCFAPTDAVADGIATVTVKQLSGDIKSGYGIIFRRPSKGNYYAFFIDSNGKWTFAKTVDGVLATLIDFKADPAIKSGLNATNTLKVQAVGQNYTFFVNDTQVGQSTDATFTSKGLWGLSGQDGLEVVYTDFSLTKP